MTNNPMDNSERVPHNLETMAQFAALMEKRALDAEAKLASLPTVTRDELAKLIEEKLCSESDRCASLHAADAILARFPNLESREARAPLEKFNITKKE